MSVWRNSERRALPTNIDPYQVSARPFYNNYSGEIVTELTAFAHSAVLAAITILADAVASMPLTVGRDRGGRIEQMPLPSVLKKPNDHQTMFEFIHQLVATVALHGNDYIYAPRGAKGNVVEMRNIHPTMVRDVTEIDNGTLKYQIGKEIFTSDDIYPVRWLVLPNRRVGVSPLEAMRNTIGMGLAMDRFLSQFYGEGATPSSILETDGSLTPEQIKQTKEAWEAAHFKHRKPAVLQGGLKWRSITTSAADMQMLEHKESIIRDIARVYRIPLHLIIGTGGDSQTYANLEATGASFYKYTLLGWVRRIETVLDQLLPAGQTVRFDAAEFLRADLLTRVRAQQTQISMGTLTPNEAREIENREPFEGGDQFVLGLVGAPLAGLEGGDLPTLGTDAIPPAR